MVAYTLNKHVHASVWPFNVCRILHMTQTFDETTVQYVTKPFYIGIRCCTRANILVTYCSFIISPKDHLILFTWRSFIRNVMPTWCIGRIRLNMKFYLSLSLKGLFTEFAQHVMSLCTFRILREKPMKKRRRICWSTWRGICVWFAFKHIPY